MAVRVLVTHERFPPDIAGGGENVVLQTAIGLRDQGAEVRVLTTGDAGLPSPDGILVERLPISRYALNLQTARFARAAEWADVVHTHTYHAALPSLRAARRLGRPAICTVLALFGTAWHGMRGPVIGRAWAAWERWLMTLPFDRLVFLSDASRRLGVEAGADAGRSVVLPPGIDHVRFRPAATRDDTVLFAGRLDTRKGIDRVMGVARALPDIPFRAVGWGDDVAAVRAAAPANLSIEESRSGPTYEQALARSRVFLFPSRAETFGLVVAEAMASGCAIVSSVDTIAFAGASVDADDLAGMVAAVRRFWNDPALSAAAGTENRRLAAAYTWSSHIDGLLGLYREAGSIARVAD